MEKEYRVCVRKELLYKFLEELDKDLITNPKIVDLCRSDGYEFWVIVFTKK